MASGHSLADSLANLLTPAPRINDAEIDADDQDAAKLAERRRKRMDDDVDVGTNEDDVDDGADELKGRSALRKKTAPLLGDVDKKYAGKTVSRKDALDEESDDDGEEEEENDEEEDDEEDETMEEEVEEEEEEEEEDDDDDDGEKDSEDEMDPDFKKILMGGGGEGDEDDDDASDEGDDEDDDDDEEEDIDEDKNLEESKKKSSKKAKKSEEAELQLFEKKLRERHLKREKEDKMRKEMLNKAEAEKRKGKAVKNQLKLFDSFLEMRIRMQKMLEIANQMPQGDGGVGGGGDGGGELWKDFVAQLEASGETAKLEKCQKAMDNLSESIIRLQTTFLSGIEETRGAVKATKGLKDVHSILEKRNEGVKKFRDSTLTTWQEKTAMTSAKSFHAFDTPILDQINLILADRQRLVNRTRTNRQSVVVLGKRKKAEDAEKSDADEDKPEGESMGKRKKDADVEMDDEIFDDSDFYQHLLRELIERKSSTITDSQALGKQMVQLHKLRIKNKRKVDTRASKGRKVRYDTHQKLIGFCASVTSPSSMPDSARDELFKSLFGQRWTKKRGGEEGEEETDGTERGAPQQEE